MKYVSEKFHEALELSSRLHECQCRKGNATPAPYVSHLLSVASTVLKCGGTEDQAIAALLHDALEDQSDKISAEEIGERFGETVRRIVLACTDELSTHRKAIPWRERKEKYLSHIMELAADEMLVVVADKLDNARDIRCNYAKVGENYWERFSGNKQGMIWYQCELASTMRSWLIQNMQNYDNPYLEELINEFVELTDSFLEYGEEREAAQLNVQLAP
jgi:(p)ppGpp synthase/HD superfamily hydrolase